MKERIIKNDPNYTSQDSPKFLLYSGHDDTLTQMQIFLNKHFNINKEWVPYASNQIFELRKYGNIFYVEIYYNDKLKLNMTFNEFSGAIKNKIMNEEEIYKKCYSFRYSFHFYRICGLLMIFLFIFILYIIIKIFFIYKEKYY